MSSRRSSGTSSGISRTGRAADDAARGVGGGRRPDARRREPCAARGHQPWWRELGWRGRGRERRGRVAGGGGKRGGRAGAPPPAWGVGLNRERGVVGKSGEIRGGPVT